MASKAIPDPLARRHLLEKSIAPDQALEIAEAYLAEDRGAEAIAFLTVAEANDRLEALLAQATEQGDAFLVRQLAVALDREPSVTEWNRTAEAAEERGLLRYASIARRQADHEEG